jgi:hypothetical protein
MSDGVNWSVDDRKLLSEMVDDHTERGFAERLWAYYHDADRADRTPRSVMYLHLGMLAGIVMRLTAVKP